MQPSAKRIRPVAALAAIAAGLTLCWTGLHLQAPGRQVTAGSGHSQVVEPPPAGQGHFGEGPVGATPSPSGSPTPSPGAPSPSPSRGTAPPPGGPCTVGAKLVPTCGVLWGVAPGAHTDRRGAVALREFERKTGRTQAIFHGYHRGLNGVFPTPYEKALAREPGRPRILFLNWKPAEASWAGIARGDARTDRFLDRLARHIRTTYREPFFFTVHHEPEDDVRPKEGSGYTARDYAAMYRYVVRRLRAAGVDNLVTVLVHMAYAPLTSKPWFGQMYPGDDVVDWIGFDTYAYSVPGYGHGDFAELVNRRAGARGRWPGFYNWAAARFRDKPLMVAEWGVWHARGNPAHKARFYRSVGAQIGRFPRIKALVHFDTPSNQKGWDSRVDSTSDGLAAYRELGALPIFRVGLAGDLAGDPRA
jgi:hypothetical protein